ncbi:nitroreductase [Actinoalloteichus sp. AHMU CJ021]|uniref:SagB-type dehydrogenase domain-containing protein n=1 Tax=Actinoalloteichus caeruleus DSM 43889 TaxID=1120930 RepID=A0ABT1JKX1_ACTCY|nr:SagB/ThcOx family dehydrogenase [Actinoalloteichus caeruleus]AUS78310.1 nitroreductase [Actinoalloteichus sp. AHMU CJ021]MCP2332381.1 SagB-type dehydrogenase domain-containing protein [Actinoalloteichus caeruleus DSM 43889]
MRLKVAEHTSAHLAEGRVVLDDYLRHRQFELTAPLARLCWEFRSFADTDEVLAELDTEERAAVWPVLTALLDAGLLVAEGTPEHRAEQRLLAAWRDGGPSARQFHYATRTLRDTPYADADEQDRALAERAVTDPPPSPLLRRRDGRAAGVPLPPISAQWTGDRPAATLADASGARWGERPLRDVLLARRTTRRFRPRPVDAARLGDLLAVLAGPAPGRPGPDQDGNLFKSSPSAGARHPIEVYPHVRSVAGLEPGWYHYDAADHVLEPLGPPWSAGEVAEASGGQEWVGEAAVQLCHVATLERTWWKYDTARAYRMVQMDMGHLSQTAYLVATAMSLGVAFTAALRDESFESVLGLDRDREIVLGLTALGWPGDDAAADLRS